ncbi:MAG: glutathione S-transferase N-terminal domain-containing protein [Gammaproteobacteria bacterium]|nr:glutathione S-transferase N-terminal domain-containing protein [Gammaproteobacteria bacterium]
MIFKLIRWPLGQLILLVDFLTRPTPPQRPAELQARIDASTRDMALYQFRACPFCVKTRRALRRLGLQIELRDARGDGQWRTQLEQEGGKIQVPCLYLPGEDGEARWLYESGDIIAYLEQHVAAIEAGSAARQAA